MNIVRSTSIAVALFLPLASLASESCTYSTYRWNAPQRKAVDFQIVRKSRSELLPAEIDSATGCTVCDEDQVEMRFSGLRPFKVQEFQGSGPRRSPG